MTSTAPVDVSAVGTSTVLTGIGSLVTNDPALGDTPLGVVPDAAVVIEGDRIVWVGPSASAPAADSSFDVGGRAVLPGWVDSHSHLLFAGDRSAEFSARMAGRPYEAGGILTTVEATRAASNAELAAMLDVRVKEMTAGGTTCIETKTGYGLTTVDEVRAASVAAAGGVDAVTFLGAHVNAPEFASDPDAYLDLVCGAMLDAIAPHVQFIDVFCEEGAFDEARTRRVLAAGTRHGLGLKVHGNQLGEGAGVRIAVDNGAVSVDHCTYLSTRDIDLLAGSSTVATLLPICDLSTRQGPAPGRALADAGATIAIASNCNPGSCYSPSMGLAVALAVLQCGLTPDEAVSAATVGGARALLRDDVGVIAVGKRADLQVLDAPTHDYLAYRVGLHLTHAVWRSGLRVA
ncbi:imidazolonepropionase [Nakamurella sp. UYEF19]|uniref:imidazolonepropionase n=1 Tax=Nakamurella sp. UYEF19 TaxID=1756392 RepID=UPI0033925585